MSSRLLVACAAVLAAVACPVPARAEAPVLPAGKLREQVNALARSRGISVAAEDSSAWNRSVPALRTNVSTAVALHRIAKAAGLEVRALGPGTWRLVRPAPPSLKHVEVPRTVRNGPSRTPVVDAAEQPDVVVVASKRDMRLERFAGQVTRIAGSDLTIGGVGGTDKLTQRIATVSSTYLGAGRNKLFIRGIADSSFTGPTQATVGQYLGDLRLSYNAPDPDLRLSDMASVEVLEGPQGSLYGTGSLGGIIRLVPNAPVLDRTEGSAILGASTIAHGALGSDASMVLNVPVVDNRLAVRLVADAANDGGYIDKPLLGRDDVNRTRIGQLRGAARLQLGGEWTIDLVGVGQRIRGADSQYADRDAPPLTRNAAVGEGFRADYAQGQVIVAGRVGGVDLKSSTGLGTQRLLERYDATEPDGPLRRFEQRNHTRLFANETRAWRTGADGSGWLLGTSYTDNRTRLERALGPPDAPSPVTGVVNRIREATLFGEGTLRIVSGLLVTAGMRITHATLSGEGADVAPALVLARAAITATRHDTRMVPSAALLANVLPGTTIYAKYQQGFRPGGLAIESDFVRRFRGDRTSTFEAGARLRRNDTSAAMSVAYTTWQDIQADFIDGSGLPSTANIGDGRLWTLTASGSQRVTPHVRVDLAFSYNNGRVIEPEPALAFALLRMSQIPNIARAVSRVGVQADGQLGSLPLKLDAWGRYVGLSRLGIGPILGQRQGDYLDTGLTVRVGPPALGVSASVDNIFDTVGNRFALGTPFTTGREQVTPLRPRTLRLAVDAAF